jgi:aminoglycoside 6'-N-acetyltransferase I
MKVRKAQPPDREEVTRMMALLWPDASIEDLSKEFDSFLPLSAHESAGTLPSELLVSCDEDGTLTGFIEVGLRSHADGCDIAQPVGFIEGWFVHEHSRHCGVGRELMRAAEDWARAQGCREMASDTWIDHDESQRAHVALGFEIVDRCVHFRKPL